MGGTIGIAKTDPFGTLCALSGSLAIAESDHSLLIKIPIYGGVAAFGVYHIANMLNQERNLHQEVQNEGISESLLDKYNRSAMCARTMLREYLDKHNLSELKERLKSYSVRHYVEREWRRWKIGARMLRRGKNPFKAIFR